MKSKLIIDKEGNRRWLLNGKRHRINGLAVEYPGGGREWWISGKLHRVGGPAIELNWYQNDKRHRTGGPAIELNWYNNGERHRIDGPAVEFINGYKEWWLNNKKYTEEDYEIEIRNR